MSLIECRTVSLLQTLEANTPIYNFTIKGVNRVKRTFKKNWFYTSPLLLKVILAPRGQSRPGTDTSCHSAHSCNDCLLIHVKLYNIFQKNQEVIFQRGREIWFKKTPQKLCCRSSCRFFLLMTLEAKAISFQR